jgi:hypothetical protein
VRRQGEDGDREVRRLSPGESDGRGAFPEEGRQRIRQLRGNKVEGGASIVLGRAARPGTVGEPGDADGFGERSRKASAGR